LIYQQLAKVGVPVKVSDIMTRNPECVTPSDSVQQAARIMRDSDIGIVPVVDDCSSLRLRGVITDRDIAVRCVAEGKDGNCRITELMSSDLVTAREDDDLRRVMDRMKAEQVRRIPVIDDNNVLIGIVAQADIALDGQSEKAVGDLVERISEPGGR
jgi:CBS domain-containing protein